MDFDMKLTVLLYCTITCWRKAFRLRILVYFIMSLGVSFVTAGSILFSLTQKESLIIYIFLYSGAILFFGTILFLATKYSGLEKEIKKRTTFLQRMTGYVPKDIEIKKDYPPGHTQKVGVFTGILIIIEVIVTYFYPKYFGSNYVVNIFIIAFGIMIIVLTLIYIKSSTQEEHME